MGRRGGAVPFNPSARSAQEVDPVDQAVEQAVAAARLQTGDDQDAGVDDHGAVQGRRGGPVLGLGDDGVGAAGGDGPAARWMKERR